MFCFIHRTNFQQYKPIFKYQESSHKNPELWPLPKNETIWHPLDLYSRISTIVQTWIAAALSRPPSSVGTHTLQLSPQHCSQVLLAIYDFYCNVGWIMGEKYFSVSMSLSTPGKQKSHMIQEKWERVYLFVEVKTVLYVKMPTLGHLCHIFYLSGPCNHLNLPHLCSTQTETRKTVSWV